MPIKVQCESCNKKFAVKDEFAGKRVRCPDCREVVKIPGTAGTAASGQFEGKDIPAPPVPESIEDTGLPIEFISDLGLKILYTGGVMTGYEIVNEIKLPFRGVMEHVFRRWRDMMYVQAKSSTSSVQDEATYQFIITDDGKSYVLRQLDLCQYVGPCPVTLEDYIAMMDMQTIKGVTVREEDCRRAFSGLVLADEFFAQIGPAINSGRSVFLYGPPGNGKSSIAECIADLLGKPVFVPYAMSVGTEIIKIYDDVAHQAIEDDEDEQVKFWSKKRGRRTPIPIRPKQGQDARWVLCRRPAVVVGGELTLHSLDLQYNPVSKYYEAPFQLKANGGVFVIDDLGRQLIRPQDLLNRWIVPLERRIDYLTFHTGRKFEIPFDELIVFSTNLDPKDLVDEAFLRRIRYKLLISNPSLKQYAEIFERVCRNRGIAFEPEMVEYIYQEYYRKRGYSLRNCHPRDIADQIIDIARFHGETPAMTKELIDQAWESYFVEL